MPNTSPPLSPPFQPSSLLQHQSQTNTITYFSWIFIISIWRCNKVSLDLVQNKKWKKKQFSFDAILYQSIYYNICMVFFTTIFNPLVVGLVFKNLCKYGFLRHFIWLKNLRLYSKNGCRKFLGKDCDSQLLYLKYLKSS